MNSDFRVSVDFFAHHKTRKLRRRLGYECEGGLRLHGWQENNASWRWGGNR